MKRRLRRPGREQQATLLFLLFVDLLIWANMLLRPLPLLGVEMASTGEVGCFGRTFEEALAKALRGA